MTPLEQHVREALTDEVLLGALTKADEPWDGPEEMCEAMRTELLDTLRPLLEQQAKRVETLEGENYLLRDNYCIQAAAVATLTAERDEARQMASLWHRDCHPRNRNGLTFSLHEHDAKKIAAWSGETR